MTKKARLSPRAQSALLLAGLLIAGTASGIVLYHTQGRPIYSKGVDGFFREKGSLEGIRVRVHGALAPGSLKRAGSPCTSRFTLRGQEKELSVVHDGCVLPDNFCDAPGADSQVTVEGELDVRSDTFAAQHIQVSSRHKVELQRAPDGGLVLAHPQPCLR